MTIVLFRNDDEITVLDSSSAVQTEPALFNQEQVQGVTLWAALVWDTTSLGPQLDIHVSDSHVLEIDAELGENWEQSNRGTTQSSFLMHKHFANFQCSYTSTEPGSDTVYAEALGNRMAKRLPLVPDNKGFLNRNSAIPTTPICLTTAKKDQSQVVVIDPLSSVVTMMDYKGNTLDRYSMPKGEFADVVSIDADNEYYWVLRWESADFKGGNKFNFNAYTWEDSSLVEWEWESHVEMPAEFAEDRILKTGQEKFYVSHFVITEVVATADFFVDMDGEFITDREVGTVVELEELVTYVDVTPTFEAINNILGTDAFIEDSIGVGTFAPVDDYHEVDIAGEYTFATGMDIMLAGDTPIMGIVTDFQGIGIDAGVGTETGTLLTTVAVSTDVPAPDMLIQNAIDISITDDYFIEWRPYVCTEVDVSEIRLEKRFSMTRMNQMWVVDDGEQNHLRQLFNVETDVWPLEYSVNPVRTEDMKHEYPFMEERRHYYGHWSDYEFAKERGLELKDAWFVPPYSIDANPFYAYNKSEPYDTRNVTAPHFAVTETKMIFGVVRHRGMYPYRDTRYSTDDPKYRSSQTLLYQLDKDTKWPATTPVNINMSGAQAFQANDDLGLVMVDSFWEMGTDNLLKGWGETFTTHFDSPADNPLYFDEDYWKLPDIVRYDFDFNQVSANVQIFGDQIWTVQDGSARDFEISPDSYALNEDRAHGRNMQSVSLYPHGMRQNYFSRAPYYNYGTDWFYPIGNEFYDDRTMRHPQFYYNGCLRLNGTSLIYRDDLLMYGVYSYETNVPHTYYEVDEYYEYGLRNSPSPGYYRTNTNWYGYGTINNRVGTTVRLFELDSGLNAVNSFLIADPLTNLLCYHKEDVYWAVSTFVDVMPLTSWTYILSDQPELCRSAHSPLVFTDAELNTKSAAELVYLGNNSVNVDVFLDSQWGIGVDISLIHPGYREVVTVISNSSPNEIAHFPCYTVPSGIIGTYPYSARFWTLGSGYAYGYDEVREQKRTPAWNIKPLRPWDYYDYSDHYSNYEKYKYKEYPYPVQYVSDNQNEIIFGLYRVPEGPDFNEGTTLEKARVYAEADEFETEEEYNEEYGGATDINIAPYFGGVVSENSAPHTIQNTGCGGWLSKFTNINEPPTKITYVPGHFFKDTEADYDPFVQVRYFGNSPTNRKLYVIRAYGRRDYWHSIPFAITGRTVFVTDPEAEIPVYSEDHKFYGNFVVPGGSYDYFEDEDERAEYITNYPPWTPRSSYKGYEDGAANYVDDNDIRLRVDWATFEDGPNYWGDNSNYPLYWDPMVGAYGLTGKSPSEDNVANITPYRGDGASNYYPETSMTRWTFTSAHLTGPSNLAFVRFNYIDDQATPLYEQMPNVYDDRDLLVYDYDLNLVSTISSLQGLPDEDVILHVLERDSIFYVLTHVKAEEEYNWAQFNATKAVGRHSAMAYEDDKYGYCYDRTRLYKIPHNINGTAELIYELPWAGHSVGDTLIQEVTDDHIWLNWSGVHKDRAGQFLGVGVKLDGTGYIEIPGLVAILYGQYEPEKWHLLCYTNMSHVSFYYRSTNTHRYSSTSYEDVPVDRFPRWGDGERTQLSIYREKNIEFFKHDQTWHSLVDWLNHWPNWKVDNYDVYGDPIRVISQIIDSGSAGGTQPGYSQVVYRRYYDWVHTDVALRATGVSLKPQTWITTTTGGGNTISL